MKITGLFLLAAGWIIVLSALALIDSAGARAAFALAGAGVEVLGLGLLARAHLLPRGDE